MQRLLPSVWVRILHQRSFPDLQLPAPAALVASGGDHGELLADIAAGTTRMGIAFGEAIKRRNDAGVSVKDGRMSGTSMYAFDAEADAYLVADEHQHIYLVRTDDPGLTRSDLATVDKTRRTVELNYENVAAELVSADPTVFAASIDIGRMALAADTLGAARRICSIKRWNMPNNESNSIAR